MLAFKNSRPRPIGALVALVTVHSRIFQARLIANLPDPRLRVKAPRTRAPSLHPVSRTSSVLRAPPLPRTIRPRRTAGSSDLPSCGVSRVAPSSVSTCRLHCPGGQLEPYWWLNELEPGGLPRVRGGSASTTLFRGVLRVHSRYGPPTRGPTNSDPFPRGFERPVAPPLAPVATEVNHRFLGRDLPPQDNDTFHGAPGRVTRPPSSTIPLMVNSYDTPRQPPLATRSRPEPGDAAFSVSSCPARGWHGGC